MNDIREVLVLACCRCALLKRNFLKSLRATILNIPIFFIRFSPALAFSGRGNLVLELLMGVAF